MDLFAGVQRSLSSHWQSFSIRLKLIWVCFAVYVVLQFIAKVVGFLWPEGSLGGLAFVFIVCVIVGLFVGLELCEIDDTKIVKFDKFMSWTEPLTSGIQSIHLPPPINEPVKEEYLLQVPDDVFQVGKELEYFVQLIMRDFIHLWYDEYIQGDENFPTDIADLLTYAFSEILSRLRSVDLDLLLDGALKEIHRHLTIMEKSKSNLRRLNRSSVDQNNDNLVACYETFSVMHSAAMSEDLEMDYLRSALGMIIDCLLPQNIKVCQPGVLLVREIVSQAVLLEVIDLISDPDFINEAIVLLATFGESEVDQSKVSSKANKNENGTDEQSSCLPEKNKEGNHYVQTLSAEVIETPNSSDNCCHKVNDHNDKVHTHQARRDNQPILTETKPSSKNFRESCNDESAAKNIQTFSHTENVITNDEHAVAKTDSKVEEVVLNLHQSVDPKGDGVSPEKPETVDCPGAGEDTTQEGSATKEQMSSSNENLLQSKFEKAATFSGLSNFMPVPLPRRNKSPAFSTLSKSVDSILELEETSDELVTDKKERRGHSRNSSFPSFTLGSDSEDDQIQDEDESEDGEQLLSEGRDESGREAEKYISNLVISSTEQMQEKHGKKTFVLYVVKFDILASRNEDEVGPSLIPLQAKRRYREFVTLHWKLEQHADFKKFLKGVKDAPKRFAFPIMRKDTAGVEQRRVTLERYLKQLVDNPEIQISQEMAEFLALNGDASIAFVRNSSSFLAPNFDMLLRNSFSGMKQGLKNLAPFPSSKLDQKEDRSKVTVQSNSAGMEEDEEAISPQVYRVCSMAPEGSELNLLDRMPSMIQEALTGLELAVEAMQDTSDLVQSDVIRRILKDKVPTGKKNTHSRTRERRVAIMDTSSLVLFSKIMDIVGVLQRDQAHWIFEENVQHLLRNLAGDFIEKFVRREVQTFLSPQSWSVYLALIREAVWPEGNLFNSVEGILTSEEKQELYKKAEGIVLSAYPDTLNFIIGKENMTGAISQLLESVQNQQLNKHLIYTFIDLVLEQALPEVQQEKTKETLAF